MIFFNSVALMFCALIIAGLGTARELMIRGLVNWQTLPPPWTGFKALTKIRPFAGQQATLLGPGFASNFSCGALKLKVFLAISPPTNTYDLSFLAPCPSSGLVLYGTEDSITPHEDVTQALSRVRTQKGKKITPQPLEGADHFYRGTYLETMLEDAGAYLDEHLDMVTS